MTQRRCPACDADPPADARFCGRCGAALPGAARPGERQDAPRDRDVVERTGPTLVLPHEPSGADAPGPAGVPGTVGRERGGRRGVLLGVVVTVLGVLAVLVVTRPPTNAIVVGDGLLLASGAGPSDRPAELWGVEVPVSEPLPPVVVDDTIVLGGVADDVAAAVGVDVASGRSLWRAALGLDLAVVAVLPSGADVVTVATDGETTAVARFGARTGQPVWRTRTVLFGDARTGTALPEGRVLVELAGTEEQRGRAVVLDEGGALVLDVEADAAAAAADLIAVLDGSDVRTFRPAGEPVGTVPAGDDPVDAMTVADGLVVVAHGTTVTASDAATGEQRWSTTVDDPVVALAPSAAGVSAITLGDHVGLGTDGEPRWQHDGYPLPLVRDGDDVTALVAPGVEDEFVVDVVDPGGEVRSSARVREGQYVALGGDTVLSALGEDVVGTRLDDDTTPPWRVTTAGEVRWVVLDGPRMLVVGDARGDTALSSWR